MTKFEFFRMDSVTTTIQSLRTLASPERYYVLDATGALARMNAHGKAVRWAYARRSAALAAARRCRGVVYDRQCHTVLDPHMRIWIGVDKRS